jgi:hypothetical protein
MPLVDVDYETTWLSREPSSAVKQIVKVKSVSSLFVSQNPQLCINNSKNFIGALALQKYVTNLALFFQDLGYPKLPDVVAKPTSLLIGINFIQLMV